MVYHPHRENLFVFGPKVDTVVGFVNPDVDFLVEHRACRETFEGLQQVAQTRCVGTNHDHFNFTQEAKREVDRCDVAFLGS